MLQESPSGRHESEDLQIVFQRPLRNTEGGVLSRKNGRGICIYGYHGTFVLGGKFMKNKKFVLAAIALVVIVAIGLGLYFGTRPKTTAGEKAFTVTVVHGDGTSKDFAYTSAEEYVGTVLLEAGLIAGEMGDYGLYIHEVDGERAVYEEDGAYWGFYVNGEYAMQGIDLTPIEDGANYKLEYTKD